MAVAVVTGSNKGIGFAIVRALCKEWPGTVYLTARDVSRGQAAVEELKSEGLNPSFHQLDITDAASLAALATYLQDKYGGLDILVNNAGIAYKNNSTAPFLEQAEVTLATNYFATVKACEALFPLLRPGARVCHVSSMNSVRAMAKVTDPQLRERILASRTVDDVTTLMREFISHVAAGDHVAAGWPNMAYGVSKIGVTAITSLQQVAMDAARPGDDVVINSCCPGYVDTDMSSHKGPKTVDQGAETPTMLALLPADTAIRGEYLSEKQVQAWH